VCHHHDAQADSPQSRHSGDKTGEKPRPYPGQPRKTGQNGSIFAMFGSGEIRSDGLYENYPGFCAI